MSTLKAKKIRGALQKARNVGRAEESVTVDGCTIVLQSMPSSYYDAILKEVEDLEGAEYLHEYQNGYLCRAIVEIEGVDLRDVEFVEDDVPAGSYLINACTTEAKAKKAKEELAKLDIDLVLVPPDGSEGERTILLERHEWIRNQIKTWSQEALAVAWRKYADVVVTGEARAREKVEFRTPDETKEDKFRRLISEAKALENELPPEMLAAILAESGYLQKASAAELDATSQRLRTVVVQEPPKASSKPVEPEEEALEEDVEPVRPVMTPEALAQKVRTRVPLNRMAVEEPQQGAISQQPPPLNSKTAKIAELEGFDPTDPAITSGYPVMQDSREVPEISKKPPIDGRGARSIIDAPSVVGLNPRFRPPPRHG
jgi:hypothetical protein